MTKKLRVKDHVCESCGDRPAYRRLGQRMLCVYCGGWAKCENVMAECCGNVERKAWAYAELCAYQATSPREAWRRYVKSAHFNSTGADTVSFICGSGEYPEPEFD